MRQETNEPFTVEVTLMKRGSIFMLVLVAAAIFIAAAVALAEISVTG